MKTVLDSNILIDYLNGLGQARGVLDSPGEKAISIMTWMEVMVGADVATAPRIRGFLEDFELIPLDSRIAELAVILRQEYRLKLPDAVIWASASTRSMVLLTRNTRDFPKNDPGVQFPYRLA